MKPTKVVPMRVPVNLYELAGLRAQIEHMDRSTVLRQWLHDSAAKYAVQLVSDGRITIGKAAEYLDVSIFDIHHLAETYEIEIGATVEQWRKSLELVDKLLAERKDQASSG